MYVDSIFRVLIVESFMNCTPFQVAGIIIFSFIMFNNVRYIFDDDNDSTTVHVDDVYFVVTSGHNQKILS